MKYSLVFSLVLLSQFAIAQNRLNPVISPYGGIFDIPEATIKADTSLVYKIIIDVVTGSEKPTEQNWALNNVARLLNLHAVAGADVTKMEVVLAIHGEAAYTISDEAYEKKYKVKNPNAALIEALSEAGVTLTVCGQSLKARDISVATVNKHVTIATSMLTTVTTYQLKGFAYLKF